MKANSDRDEAAVVETTDDGFVGVRVGLVFTSTKENKRLFQFINILLIIGDSTCFGVSSRNMKTWNLKQL